MELRFKKDIPTVDLLYSIYHEDVHKRIYFLLSNYGNSIVDADDLSQETWVKVTNSYHKVPDDWDVKAWVLRVSVNVTIDFMRRKKRKQNEVEIPTEYENKFSASPEESFIHKELIEATYNKLRPQDQIVVKMYAENYTYDDILLVLNTTKSRVKMRVSRGKKRFRDTYLDLNSSEKRLSS
jgi:RNA polymerase sigma-70 factor (ECF subfamily)